jgi:hemin uptake protein HemP
MESEPPNRPSRQGAPAPQPSTPLLGANVVDAGSLFGNRRELLIAHAGSFYRLRITQNNKLILTK